MIKYEIGGTAGNAFAIIGFVHNELLSAGKTKEEVDAVVDDMQSSDYQHLLEVFDKHFGTVITIVKNGKRVFPKRKKNGIT